MMDQNNAVSKKTNRYNLQILHKILHYQEHKKLESSFNSLTTKKADDKISSAEFQKNGKSKLYHIKSSKTRGQTV